MNKFLVSIFVIFSLVSCQREDESNGYRNRTTTVKACAIDATLGDTLPGATIYLGKVLETGGPVTYVTHAIADSTGFVNFSFNYDENYFYYIYGGMGDLLLQEYVVVQIAEQNNLSILLHHPGYIQLHIQNTSPVDTNDLLSIYDSDYFVYEHLFAGMNVDTNLVIKQYGNVAGNIKWKITKNDTTISYNQSVTSIADDTLFLDLFY